MGRRCCGWRKPNRRCQSAGSLTGQNGYQYSGCPPNPHNFTATVAHIITYGTPPRLDAKNRPTFAYGRLIHEHCERRPHFDAGRFAKEFGDEGHRQGWCLYHLGCKGPETWATVLRYSSVTLAASGQWRSVILAMAVTKKVSASIRAFTSLLMSKTKLRVQRNLTSI